MQQMLLLDQDPQQRADGRVTGRILDLLVDLRRRGFAEPVDDFHDLPLAAAETVRAGHSMPANLLAHAKKLAHPARKSIAAVARRQFCALSDRPGTRSSSREICSLSSCSSARRSRTSLALEIFFEWLDVFSAATTRRDWSYTGTATATTPYASSSSTAE